jgi:hypothetical protein
MGWPWAACYLEAGRLGLWLVGQAGQAATREATCDAIAASFLVAMVCVRTCALGLLQGLPSELALETEIDTI